MMKILAFLSILVITSPSLISASTGKNYNLYELVSKSDISFIGTLTNKGSEDFLQGRLSYFTFCNVVLIFGDLNVDNKNCLTIYAKQSTDSKIVRGPNYSINKRYVIFKSYESDYLVSSYGEKSVFVEYQGRIYNYYGKPLISFDQHSNFDYGTMDRYENAISSQTFIENVTRWRRDD